MEENFENKVDELKVGINELLRRSSADDKNFNSMRDELAALILGDIKRTMNEKHVAMNEQLQKFESLVNSVLQGSDNQKLLVETTRIASDLNTVYTKISAQEMLLQNMYKLVDTLKNDKTQEIVAKLNGEFINFSRGFEQITITLNKNFTEFLAQVQAYSSKEEFKKLQIDLDGINNNTNAIISALAIIDHKYQDLKSLITLITEKENTFIEGLQELNQIGNQFNSFALSLNTLSSKEDTNILNEKITGVSTSLTNLRTQYENIDNEQKARFDEYFSAIDEKLGELSETSNVSAIMNDLQLLCSQFSSLSEAIKTDVAYKLTDFAKNLTQNMANLHTAFSDEFEALKVNISQLNAELINLQTTVGGSLDDRTEQLFSFVRELSLNISNLKESVAPLLDGNLNSSIFKIEENINRFSDENFIKMHGIIQTGMQNLDDTIELRLNGNTQILTDTIKAIQTDVQSVFTQLASYKDFLSDTNKENMLVMRELIEKALSNIENLRIGTQLKQLAIVVEQNAELIKDSFETMRSNFAQISESSNIEVLKQLNASIPGIADKLEIFRTLISNENTQNIEEIRVNIDAVIKEVKNNAELTADKLRNDFEKFNEESVEKIKNQLAATLISHREDIEKIAKETIEKAEVTATNVTYELVEYKTAFTNLSDKLNEKFEGVSEKIDGKLDSTKQDISTKFDVQRTLVDKIITDISDAGKNISEKFSEISTKIENFGQKSSEAIGEIISQHNSKLKNTLNEANGDILSHITSSFDHLRSSFENSCEKITNDVSTKIANSNGLTAQNITELKNTVNEFNNKTDSNYTAVTDKLNSVLEGSEDAVQKLEQLKADLVSKIDSGFDSSKIETILFALDRLKIQIQDFSDTEAGFSELARLSSKSLIQKIDQLADDVATLSEKIETGTGDSSETKDELNTTALKEFISGLEFLQSNFIDELKSEFKVQKDVFKELGSEQAQAFEAGNIKKIVQDAIEGKLPGKRGMETASGYSIEDIEADFAKLRASLEYEQKLHLPDRLDEIRNIGIENIRLSKKSENQINGLSDWLNSTNKTIELLTEKIEKAEKLNIQEIKTRLLKSEEISASENLTESMNELMANVSKKYQIQEIKIENIDEKISTLIQKQADIVDMKSFIDTFHENALQTKSLIARVEGIENQINGIHNNLEKIIKYIEE